VGMIPQQSADDVIGRRDRVVEVDMLLHRGLPSITTAKHLNIAATRDQWLKRWSGRPYRVRKSLRERRSALAIEAHLP
ncbi:MAG: hypothetical protein WBQ78_13365, partial [Gammaproteobacteria bacterium]